MTSEAKTDGATPSGDGAVSFAWGGEFRTFNCGRVGELRELQSKCDAGPMEILVRLQTHTWRVDDYLHVIRLGLIGAGVPQHEVAVLVKRYVEGRPPLESVMAAKAILSCALSWPADDSLEKKKEARKRKSKRSSASADGSSSRNSTASAPQSDSARETSTVAPFGSLRPASTATIEPMEPKTNRP